MAGRRPKPTAIKELEGNPGGRPLNAEEPKVKKGVPEMPKGMGVAAKREWKIITRELMQVGVLSVVDGKALGEYCKAMGLAETYYKEALKEPIVSEPVLDKQGDLIGWKRKPNPAAGAYVRMSKLGKTYLIEFGLTPASRTKIKVEKAAAEDPNDHLLNRKHGQTAEVVPDEIDLDSIDENVIQ